MLGILILNYNSYDACLLAIESIFNNLIVEEFKVLVLDNRSTDNSYALLNKKYAKNKDVIVKMTNHNGGFSYGNNIGIKTLRDLGCNDVIISNPDIIFEANSINQLIKEVNSRKDIAYAVPRILCPNNVGELYFRDILNFRMVFCDSSIFKFINKLYLKKHIDNTFDKSTIFENNIKMSGCCIYLTGEFLRRNNDVVYDNNMFLFYEEDVLAKKVMDMDMKGLYVGTAEVSHHHDYSKPTTGFTKVQYYKSALYFVRKYRGYNKVAIFYLYLRYLLRFSLTSIYKKDYRKYIKDLRHFYRCL